RHPQVRGGPGHRTGAARRRRNRDRVVAALLQRPLRGDHRGRRAPAGTRARPLGAGLARHPARDHPGPGSGPLNTPNPQPLTMKRTTGTLLLAAAIGLGACSTPDAEARPEEPEAHAPAGPLFTV